MLKALNRVSLSLLVGALITACEPVERAIQPSQNAAPIQKSQAQSTTASITPVAAQSPRYARQPFTARRCLNVGNALEAENEGDWGYRIEADHFRIIRQGGFDSVRIPVRWDTHASYTPPYRINPRYMNRVKQVVAQAQARGLEVILDVHHYDPLIDNPRRELPRFVAIWDQIATVFQTAPGTVYFEILNEPTDAVSHAQLNQMYEAVIPVIRRTNPTRPLILGGNAWNGVATMKYVNWPRDPNIIATFHDYGPYEFTHQGASWSNPPPPVGRKWGARADYRELKNTYDAAANFHNRTGLPIYVGEFGVINTVPDNERAEWIRARRKAMESAGYSWCVWDFSGAFSLYDLSRGQWRPGLLSALMDN